MKRTTLLTVLILLFSYAAFAQAAKISTPEEIDRDLKLVPCNYSERLAAVQSLFRSMGATDADMSVEDVKGTKNFVVTKKGSSAETIIVGAHYDKVSDGCGAIDNWTGIVTIAHLYRTLHNLKTAKTLKFIAFDKEEKGLVGSDVFVSAIPKADRASVCSMVNIDSFGFTAPWVMENSSDKSMLAAAKALWKEMKLDLTSVAIEGADADSSSFKKVGIPAITFTGLDGHWAEFLHSKRDQLTNLKPESVFLGYRLVLPFIAELDKASCDSFRKK